MSADWASGWERASDLQKSCAGGQATGWPSSSLAEGQRDLIRCSPGQHTPRANTSEVLAEMEPQRRDVRVRGIRTLVNVVWRIAGGRGEPPEDLVLAIANDRGKPLSGGRSGSSVAKTTRTSLEVPKRVAWPWATKGHGPQIPLGKVSGGSPWSQSEVRSSGSSARVWSK